MRKHSIIEREIIEPSSGRVSIKISCFIYKFTRSDESLIFSNLKPKRLTLAICKIIH